MDNNIIFPDENISEVLKLESFSLTINHLFEMMRIKKIILNQNFWVTLFFIM